MLKNTITQVLFLLFLVSLQSLPAQSSPQLIYEETFDLGGEGVQGPQPANLFPISGAWTISGNFSGLTATSDYFLTQVEAGEGFLEAQDIDAVLCFESDTLDIAAYDSVIVSADIEELGDLESSDFVDFILLIDEIEYPVLNVKGLGSASHALVGDLPDDDDFGKVAISAIGKGRKLLVKICMKNNAGTEQFRIDNVRVQGFHAADPDPVPGPDSVSHSFSLINAVTNQPIPGFDPIPDGANIDLAAIGTPLVNFRYNTTDNPDQVTLCLSRSGKQVTRTEDLAPFALFGKNQNDYFLPTTAFFRLLLFTRSGPLTLRATPSLMGTASDSKSISFTLSIGPWRLREALESTQNDLLVYPNPSRGNLIVQGDFLNQLSGLTLQIFNASGQLVYEEEVQHRFTQKVDLRRETPGLYLVKVKGEDFQRVERVLVQR